MSISDTPCYEKFQAMKKLGDRAFAAKEYQKAIECYEKARDAFRIPTHPKYLAVIERINRARNELALTAGQEHAPSYVKDGLIRPLSIHIHLYSDTPLPADEWEQIVVGAFTRALDIDLHLKQVFDLSGENCGGKYSWEYIPYPDRHFQEVAINHAQTFFESLCQSSKFRFCKLFSLDVSFPSPLITGQSVQGNLVTVVFGNEQVTKADEVVSASAQNASTKPTHLEIGNASKRSVEEKTSAQMVSCPCCETLITTTEAKEHQGLCIICFFKKKQSEKIELQNTVNAVPSTSSQPTTKGNKKWWQFWL